MAGIARDIAPNRGGTAGRRCCRRTMPRRLRSRAEYRVNACPRGVEVKLLFKMRKQPTVAQEEREIDERMYGRTAARPAWTERSCAIRWWV